MARRRMQDVMRVLAALGVLALARVTLAQPAAPPVLRDIGVAERVGERIPLDLALTDSAGRAVTLGQFFGSRPVLLVMAYNRCEMLCNLVLRGLADGLRKTKLEPGRDYQLVTVSIDPRDTPDRAAGQQALVLERLGRPGEPERWPFLVADEPAIRALARSLGFRYAWDQRTSQYAHPAVVFVLTPEGVIARALRGIVFGGPMLETALAGAAAGALAPGEGDDGVLSCFRFDALLRKYGPIIERLFSIGALVILAAVALTVALLFRRERKARR